MSIEQKIPKDICKYESKLIGPLTSRQTFCLVPACALGVVSYILSSNYIPTDAAIFLAVIVMVPLILCGWYKPYGVPFEKFVRTVLITMLLSPKNRLYKIRNKYDSKATPQKQQKKKKFKSKNPEYHSYK